MRYDVRFEFECKLTKFFSYNMCEIKDTYLFYAKFADFILYNL